MRARVPTDATLLQAARKQIATEALRHDLHLHGDSPQPLANDIHASPRSDAPTTLHKE